MQTELAMITILKDILEESKGFKFIEGTSQILTQLIALNLITSTEQLT